MVCLDLNKIERSLKIKEVQLPELGGSVFVRELSAKELLIVEEDMDKKGNTLGVAYLITEDIKYADRAWEEVENVCDFKTWNHTVHDLDSTTFLESVALAYDWLYDYLDDTQKVYIIEKCNYHILKIRLILKRNGRQEGLYEYNENGCDN